MHQSPKADQQLDAGLSSPTMSGTRPSLVDGARVGNQLAWERLVACYQPRLIAWCQSRGLDDAAANDVSQEVWIAVAKSLPRFSSTVGKGAFRAWLWRIVHRRMIDFRRQQSRGPLGTGGSTMLGRLASYPEEIEPDSSGAGCAGLKKKELSAEIQDVLARISLDFELRTWQAFLRTALDGHSTEQVANEFGMSTVGVRQLRSRILRRIRIELKQLNAGLSGEFLSRREET